MSRARSITDAITSARARRSAAISAFLTAGFPTRESWRTHLLATAAGANLIEIGVPFSDPMADGVTVQRSSREALKQGVTLSWILDELAALQNSIPVPLVLMSYLNPLLAFGWEGLVKRAAEVGVSGVIVPDLPLEEQGEFRPALEASGIGLVQLVTPITPPERLAELCRRSDGFVYAVTVTGVTGGAVGRRDSVTEYLRRVREASPVPVLAGFGVRSAADVQRLCPPADGVIVGSALIEAIEQGIDPQAFLNGLRREGVSS